MKSDHVDPLTGLDIMNTTEDLARLVHRIGFRCKGCGDCCRKISKDSNLVLVSPPEVRRIMDATGMQWDDIAEPYPDFIESPLGCRITFAWCLRRVDDGCIFLKNGRCSIYTSRPWICRTYPFMLGEGGILSFECGGLGVEMSYDEALQIASCLMERHAAEEEEIKHIRESYADSVLVAGMSVVIDSEGVKRVHG
jgi:Fe-S-cluster containining protein